MERVRSSDEEYMSISGEEEMEVRRGPWTVEEDFTLINYIAHHGEGRWNSLATSAGLKRTGKSCRLRWLNYLRPDVRRGNITLEEQLLILELHSRWGNRWSKIAQHLPGRTDNEIKNYWRTRVQKHAKQLKCDVNSKQFKDTMRYLWMPRLVERIQASASASASALPPSTYYHPQDDSNNTAPIIINNNNNNNTTSAAASTSDHSFINCNQNQDYYEMSRSQVVITDHHFNQGGLDFIDEHSSSSNSNNSSQWMDATPTPTASHNLWNVEEDDEFWFSNHYPFNTNTNTNV